VIDPSKLALVELSAAGVEREATRAMEPLACISFALTPRQRASFR